MSQITPKLGGLKTITSIYFVCESVVRLGLSGVSCVCSTERMLGGSSEFRGLTSCSCRVVWAIDREPSWDCCMGTSAPPCGSLQLPSSMAAVFKEPISRSKRPLQNSSDQPRE